MTLHEHFLLDERAYQNAVLTWANPTLVNALDENLEMKMGEHFPTLRFRSSFYLNILAT